MNFLDEVRKDREPLAGVLKKHAGIRRTVEELYPDNAHFIYELLQNAEDTRATHVQFTLTHDALVFEHNGRAFTEADIWAITDIGEGTKAKDDDKIGRFGVGFKAVFAYSETPHIYSPTFCFKISELVLPSSIAAKHGLNNKTQFVFPFNNPKKTPQQAFDEIKQGLSSLSVASVPASDPLSSLVRELNRIPETENTLLFLTHLKKISWTVIGQDFQQIECLNHTDNHIEIVKTSGDTLSVKSHFLRFSAPVENISNQNVSIVFPLDFLPNFTIFAPTEPLATQFKISTNTVGQVAVFFPAEKETSGLRFHLHAPFVPELSRASIKDTALNLPLYQQLAQLAAESLYKIRDLDLLTTDFLAALPNPQDVLGQYYYPIRDAIIHEMQHGKLTPTYSKGYAPAINLLQAKTALKELLSSEDIALLVDSDDVKNYQWVMAASQKNSNADRFLTGLNIRKWDIEDFIETIYDAENYYTFDEEDADEKMFSSWAVNKSSEWHQQLYALLYKEKDTIVLSLKYLRIVKLSNNSYQSANQAFFPVTEHQQDIFFPRVDWFVYHSGRSKIQQEEAKHFLADIGVKEVGETQQVEMLLKQNYNPELGTFSPNINDLERFIQLFEKNPDSAALFRNYYIFKDGNNSWQKPSSIYLDAPYANTMLSAFYSSKTCYPLSSEYQNIDSSRLIRFCESVGVKTNLVIDKCLCIHHPSKALLMADSFRSVARQTHYKIDEDYEIVGLRYRLINNLTVDLAKLIWVTLSKAQPKVTKARYRPNQKYTTREEPSSLMLLLKEAKWIPQTLHDTDIEFLSPKQALKDRLPSGFPFDSGSAWLKAVDFGVEARQKSEEYQKTQAVIKNLGFADETQFADAKWFAQLSVEERENIKKDRERKSEFELPTNTPRNPEHRAKRVDEQAEDAPERTFEQRNRSVSIERADVKKETEQYLRQQYTNDNGEMICQACKLPLPFKLADGHYYFEKVAFLDGGIKRHYQNYLALCPNHSAMFQYANTSKELIKDMFMSLDDNLLEIVLAQEKTSLYFTDTHRLDLQAILKKDE